MISLQFRISIVMEPAALQKLDFSVLKSCQGTEQLFCYYVLSELSLKKVSKHDRSRMEKSFEWCEVVVKKLLSSFLCRIETDGVKNKSSNI